MQKEKEDWAKAAKEEERRRLEVTKAAGYESVAEWEAAKEEEERRRFEVAKTAGYESVAEWEAAQAKGSCVCVVS